ncbi:MAG: formylglycine-generating enzyme family protein [Flammeovirgaceae bacterium]
MNGVEFKIHGITFEMQEVQGGTFTMGSVHHDKDEWPVHEVEVSSFLLGKYPVIQALWAAVIGSDPSAFREPNRPVEQVSWYDATYFCNALSKQLGKAQVYKGSGESIEIDYTANGFRLPTEAEWEYAAGGGSKQAGYNFSGGDEPNAVGWYDDNSLAETHLVGLKRPNTLGLYDMSGNVREWCNDWYADNYYSQSPENNPKGPEKGDSRVLRGGSWFDDPMIMRVACRNYDSPKHGYYHYGLRLCLPQFK